jgi:hypothetical protein
MKYETVPASANDSTRYSSMTYGAEPHCMLTNCSVLAEYQTSAPAADSMACMSLWRSLRSAGTGGMSMLILRST